MISSVSYFCGLSAAVFIAIALAMAAVRWFHMCRPYDRNPKYYYPGRSFVAAVYLCSLTLLPYVLQPDSADAWFLARLYFFPVTLYNFTILLYAYFGGVMGWRKWHAPLIVIGFPVSVSLVAAVALTFVSGDQVAVVFPWVMYIVGTIITGVCFAVMWLVLRWAKRFDEDEYSNPADFPVVFARRWSVMVAVNMALCWAGAVANSPVFLAVLSLLFSGASVLFIITALHPHRNRPVEEEVDASLEPASKSAPPKKKQKEILDAIHTVVVQQEAFLDPHLTIQDVADRSGYSRSYIAGLFKSEFGGFFPYINSLRLQHVDAYMQQHPTAPLQEALEASGFNSRQTYYAVKARLEKTQIQTI